MVMIRPEAKGQWPPPMGQALRAEGGPYARGGRQLLGAKSGDRRISSPSLKYVTEGER
jgi:hypothetical protein